MTATLFLLEDDLIKLRMAMVGANNLRVAGCGLLKMVGLRFLPGGRGVASLSAGTVLYEMS